MTKTITINAIDLATEILNNKDKIGSTDWDIYTSMDGTIDCRHNTHSNSGWFEIVDLYSFWNDEDTLSSTEEELASWLQSDGIPYFDEIEGWDNESCDFEMIDVVYAGEDEDQVLCTVENPTTGANKNVSPEEAALYHEAVAQFGSSEEQYACEGLEGLEALQKIVEKFGSERAGEIYFA